MLFAAIAVVWLAIPVTYFALHPSVGEDYAKAVRYHEAGVKALLPYALLSYAILGVYLWLAA